MPPENENITQPQLINTRFGHVVAGGLPARQASKPKVTSLLCLTCETDVNETVKRFWKAEQVPETFNEKLTEHELAESIFQNSVQIVNKTFYVDMPLKVPLEDVNNTLGSSFDSAYHRFLNLEKKLQKNSLLKIKYNEFINEFITLGHAEYVELSSYNLNKDSVYFLPHHAVINESSKTTKVRAVFDASMQTKNKVSLNDLMLNGPPVQKELFDIILLFRFGDYTFSTDIQKMYRCVMLNPQFTPLQNILFRNNTEEEIKCLRLKTVTYGLKSSAYLATRCLKELAIRFGNNYLLGVLILLNNCYVDDVLYADSNLNIMLDAKKQLQELLSLGNFNTHKWASNSPTLLDNIPNSQRQFDELELQKQECSMKALGLTINMKQDCFKIACPTLPNTDKPTKRDILSYIARFYDPMGFISPIVIKAKALMQRLWSEGIGWNDIAPESIRVDWLHFIDSLSKMHIIEIPRNVPVPESAVSVQLIGFADASSTVGYGCCIYLRVVNISGEVKVLLLCSKSRVNPISKRLSVPRLELNAAHLLSLLIDRVYNILKVKVKIDSVTLYSDSQVVLAWLKIEITRLLSYVANRVKIIKEKTLAWNWYYVKSQDNPADLISKGVDPCELSSCAFWWHGPSFLHSPTYSVEASSVDVALPGDLPELKVVPDSAVALIVQSDQGCFQFLAKFSNLNKVIRIMAYVIRFINNIRPNVNKNLDYFLHSSELQQALMLIIKNELHIYFKDEIKALKINENVKGPLKPLHPFLDSQGLVRVGGRLQNTDFSFAQKHPIILPKGSFITDLIISHEHLRLLHTAPKLMLAHLNQKYWIINGVREIKKITHKCITCFRLKASTAKQLMGSLPQQRITAARPFERVGIDFAGPVDVKNSRLRRAVISKGYVCVIVCFVTKAVHLELSSDLSTDAFLACFKRFIARRGLPSEVYCDNGGCFRGASNQLADLYKLFASAGHQTLVQEYASNQGIKFHFTPSYSPVFAGLAEAAVKSMKFHLKRIILKSILTYEQLITVLTQIEAVLNSRPLLPMSADSSDFSYLTPGHFLIGTSMVAYPESNVTDVPVHRLKHWQMCNKLTQQFWNVWHKYYLNTLQNRPKWRDDLPNVTEGMLVILKEPNAPPLFWPMARVVKVFPGKDGKVRALNLQIPNGKIYNRSLSGICILPFNYNSND